PQNDQQPPGPPMPRDATLPDPVGELQGHQDEHQRGGEDVQKAEPRMRREPRVQRRAGGGVRRPPWWDQKYVPAPRNRRQAYRHEENCDRTDQSSDFQLTSPPSKSFVARIILFINDYFMQ